MKLVLVGRMGCQEKNPDLKFRPGILFRWNGGINQYELCITVYQGAISLDNPQHTWDGWTNRIWKRKLQEKQILVCPPDFSVTLVQELEQDV